MDEEMRLVPDEDLHAGVHDLDEVGRMDDIKSF